MKTNYFFNIALALVLLSGFSGEKAYSQNYNNILNYRHPVTPTNGLKIKTNLPYINSSAMPTIFIEGYSYGKRKNISLKLSYYIYLGNFFAHTISSAGGHVPKVFLSNENGKIVIFIDDKVYLQHLTVSAFCMVSPATGAFDGWTVADEPLTGTDTVELPYENAFSGNVLFTGGVWDKYGNVGIGTTAPTEKLSVNGKIRAREIKVEAAPWPDYVFKRTYRLMPLSEVEGFIKKNGHLPDVPSAEEVAAKGIEVGANQAVLLKKIEELTLHLIEMDKRIILQQKELTEQKALNKTLQEDVKRIKKEPTQAPAEYH